MKKSIVAILLAALLCIGVASAFALTVDEVWPKGTTVTIDVPAKAGGGTDICTRYLTQALSEVVPGVNFIVNNYDTTEVGREHLKNAKPDGKTFIVHHGGAQIEYMSGSSNVSPKDDYRTVGILNMGGPQCIIASPKAPFKNMTEVCEYAKANPYKLVVGCTLGGASQVMLRGIFEGYEEGLSSQVNWVQCGSEADKLTQTASNSIDMANCSVPNGLAYEADGKLTILGTVAPKVANLQSMSELVGTALPETFKTAAEQNINYTYDSNYYLWAPKDLPDEIAEVVNECVNKSMSVQSYIDGNKQMVMFIGENNLEEAQAMFDAEWANNEEAVKAMGLYIR